MAPWAMHTHVSMEVVANSLEQSMTMLREAGYAGFWGVEHHSGQNEYAEVAIQVAGCAMCWSGGEPPGAPAELRGGGIDMALMTKRERVLRTVRFEETDRVPIYDLLQNQPVIEHFAGEPLTVENGKRLMGIAISAAAGYDAFAGRRPVRAGGDPPGERHRDAAGALDELDRRAPWHDIPGLIEWIKGEIRRTEALDFDRSYVDSYRPQSRLVGRPRRRSHRPG